MQLGKTMFETIPTLYETERSLSNAQALIVVGALVVSPVKAVFSLALVVGGVALSILFAPLALVFRSDLLGRISLGGLVSAALGTVSFFYSLINLATLGLVGFKIEWMKN